MVDLRPENVSLDTLDDVTAVQTIDFADFFRRHKTLVLGGATDLPYIRYTSEEQNYFDLFYDGLVKSVESRLPELAEIYKRNRGLVRVFGEIFKAKLATQKTFRGSFPSANEMGVKVTTPQDIRYVATPDASNPAYSDYNLNSWDLDVSAGTTINILGDGSNYYRPSPTTDQKAMHVIFGLVELGTTPSLNQFLFTGERSPEYVIALSPVEDITIEKGFNAYVYDLPGVIPLFTDYGIRFDAMPTRTGTSNIRMLAATFYEYDYYKSLEWVS